MWNQCELLLLPADVSRVKWLLLMHLGCSYKGASSHHHHHHHHHVDESYLNGADLQSTSRHRRHHHHHGRHHVRAR